MPTDDRQGQVTTDAVPRLLRSERIPVLDPGADPSGATVGQVVGENLRRIREDRKLTQHEAALACRGSGLPWTRVRVAAMERGARETVDMGTLRLLADAFGVEVAEFFAGDGDVVLSPRAQQSRSGLRASLRGESESPGIGARDRVLVAPDKSAPVRPRVHGRVIPVEADDALAKRLGVGLKDVLRAADRLWGHTLTEERDARVAALGDLEPGERQAHRGHITRELAQQIEQRIGGECV
ncbi:helix-turn-helix domain-containing protein [Parafrankia sp. BMG5.11]|uniref:helix-turn-helix domain-containing protein n=1 Tax=Parafrankia sp. BMG5.11 TaxID=222540 RepID=UPI001404752B|nr:helix-turn-helix transcriptional regulator [Parafrankia sp. BMG5.11]